MSDDAEQPDTEEAADADTEKSSPGSMPDADDVDVETVEKERAERLDPENRPDNVEIDNSERTFDEKAGMFTDNDGYDEASKDYIREEELSEDAEATEDD